MVELGNKHECLGCGTKFYDLGKTQIVCPKCDADQEELAKEAMAAEELEKEKKRQVVRAKAKSLEKPAEDEQEGGDKTGDNKEIDNDEHT